MVKETGFDCSFTLLIACDIILGYIKLVQMKNFQMSQVYKLVLCQDHSIYVFSSLLWTFKGEPGWEVCASHVMVISSQSACDMCAVYEWANQKIEQWELSISIISVIFLHPHLSQ